MRCHPRFAADGGGIRACTRWVISGQCDDTGPPLALCGALAACFSKESGVVVPLIWIVMALFEVRPGRQ